MADGQGLRWWQEEQGQKSQSASERLTSAAPPLLAVPVSAPVAEAVEAVVLEDGTQDTWAELEAEAVRRAELAKKEDAESVSFYVDRAAALRSHRRDARQMWWLFGICFLVAVLIPIAVAATHHYHTPSFGGAFGGFASFLVAYHQRKKWLESAETPTLRLAPQGLSVHAPGNLNVFLPWSEVADIKAKQFWKSRYLEIRATKRRRYVIEERYLPLSAEALAARIAVYESGRA